MEFVESIWILNHWPTTAPAPKINKEICGGYLDPNPWHLDAFRKRLEAFRKHLDAFKKHLDAF